MMSLFGQVTSYNCLESENLMLHGSHDLSAEGRKDKVKSPPKGLQLKSEPGLLVNHIDAMQWHTFQCFKVRPEEPVITNGPNMEVKISLFLGLLLWCIILTM